MYMLFEKSKIYILAGATGTEIQRRGFPTTLPMWSAKVLFEKPKLLSEIYQDYIQASADIITTNTFRTQRRTLKKAGREAEWEKINRLAVKLAKDAADASLKPILVAGSIAPLEDCYEPSLVPEDAALIAEHGEQAALIADADADFLLLETFNCIREARIAAQAAKKTGKPFAVSFVVNQNGDLLSGELIADAVKEIADLKPGAFLANCAKCEYLTKALEKIKPATDLLFGAYGNGDGKPAEGLGWEFSGDDQISDYAAHCRNWVSLGANIIGGCCGTSPEYTKEYSKLKA